MLLSEYIYIYKVICKFQSQRVELWTNKVNDGSDGSDIQSHNTAVKIGMILV